MRLFKWSAGLALACMLVACGGGGGNPGSSSGGTGGGGTGTGGGTTAPSPTVALSLTDSAGTVLTNNTINSGSIFFARAVIRNSSGGLQGNALVTFSTNAAVATLSPAATAITDSVTGIAQVQISPVAAGAAALTATAVVGNATVDNTIAFQTTPLRVGLSNLSPAQGTLTGLQSTDVTVQVRVNDVPAAASEVVVSFNATCGSFSPASATSMTGGTARSTYTPNPSCSGPVTLTANTPGAPSTSTVVTVTPSLPAVIRFSSVSNPLLVVSSAPDGIRTSIVQFQVLSAVGMGIGGTSVGVSLDARSIAAGVSFSVNGTSSTAIQTLVSDASGFVQVVVSSGTVPTPIVVSAALTSNSAVRASSPQLAVTNGRATQGRISLSAEFLNIEAALGSGTTDGVLNTLTMRIADRLGNPVPAGVAVNFVASHGRVVGACVTDASADCSVRFNTQGLRPANGLVTILAYLDGEESFTDRDGDNVWDSNEPFDNRGQVYLDVNSNGVFDSAVDQLITGTSPGNQTCPGTASNVPNTCDGTWSPGTRVSQVSRFAWSSSDGVITQVARSLTVTRIAMPAATPPVLAQFNGTLTTLVADNRGNSMPTGSTISVSGCPGATASPATVPNAVGPLNVVVNFPDNTNACILRLTVTSPRGTATSQNFTLL